LIFVSLFGLAGSTVGGREAAREWIKCPRIAQDRFGGRLSHGARHGAAADSGKPNNFTTAARKRCRAQAGAQGQGRPERASAHSWYHSFALHPNWRGDPRKVSRAFFIFCANGAPGSGASCDHHTSCASIAWGGCVIFIAIRAHFLYFARSNSGQSS